MKKFVIAKTGEEVNYGDTIRGKKNRETSFGTIEIVEDILVSRYNINNLISKGIIKCIDKSKEPDNINNNNKKFNDDNIGFYIKLLSIKYRKDIEEIIDWLNLTNKICPKAVFDLLLHVIASHLQGLDVKGFEEAENYYSLRPKDGKVGRVTNVNGHIPLFKNVEDAEKARRILKKQLEYMYGELENN